MEEKIQHDISLKHHNTFQIDVKAKSFATFDSFQDLESLLRSKEAEDGVLLLGGGSNILFTREPEKLVLKNMIQGLRVVEENESEVLLKAGAGVIWDDLVRFCVERNWGGVENLVAIPGTCGAAPIQNIGAYGVELKDTLHSLEAVHLEERKVRKFDADECGLGYRDSLFKGRYKNEYAILNITLRLKKRPVFHLDYGSVKEELNALGVKTIRTADIARAIRNIRNRKIPDPKILGNAGSFFKNPVVTGDIHARLKEAHATLVSFPQEDGTFKIAAGWLLEKAGWKGRRESGAGCHDKQALILVNYGTATGKEILSFSEGIIQDVETKFGIRLEREVNII